MLCRRQLFYSLVVGSSPSHCDTPELIIFSALVRDATDLVPTGLVQVDFGQMKENWSVSVQIMLYDILVLVT